MRYLIASMLLLTAICPAAAPAAADDVTGIWLTNASDGDKGYIQIYKRDDELRGRIVGAPRGHPRRDENNPDPSKRDEPLLGKDILRGFHYADDGVWQGGTIYDANSGKTYKAKLWLTDENTLKLRGYLGFSLLGRTVSWTRVDKQAPGVVGDALK